MRVGQSQTGLSLYPTLVTPPPPPPPPMAPGPFVPADLSPPVRKQSSLILPVDTPLTFRTSIVPTHSIKWHPGWYGGSGGTAEAGDTLSKFSPEMDDMLKDPWIVGYKIFMSWAGLDKGSFSFTSSVGGAVSGTLTSAPGDATYWVRFSNGQYRSVVVSGTSASWSGALSAGNITSGWFYTFQLIDDILNRLKTNYSSQKYLMIMLSPMIFDASGNPYRTPTYILNNSSYGAAPASRSGQFGFWGVNQVGTGTVTTATYRAAITTLYANLGAALGAKYDSDPNFEAIMDQETSAITGDANPQNSYGPGNSGFPNTTDPTWTQANQTAANQNYLTAWVNAFPHTNVACPNTFMFDPTSTQNFQAWMMANRVATSSDDSSGLQYYTVGGHTSNSWGQAAYFGIIVSGSSWAGGPDKRGTVPCIMDVEQPDLYSVDDTTGHRSIGYTATSVAQALNQVVKATHGAFCHVGSTFGSNPAPTWAQITAALQANPLQNTAYPSSYP